MIRLSSAGELTAKQQDQGIALAPQQLAMLFPYHLAFDRELRVVQAGTSLTKCCPGLTVGRRVDDFFVLERPKGRLAYSIVRDNPGALFILKSLDRPLMLRGQALLLPDESILLACSAWLPDPQAIRALGLSSEDFPLHDSTLEISQLIQMERMALEDMQRLTRKINSQKEQLQVALETLRQQENESRRLALIAARTDNLVIVTDEKGLIQWVNKSFEQITGYTLAEAVGRPPGSLLQGPQTDPRTIEYIRRQLHRGEGFRCEILNYAKDGRRYWVNVEVQAIHDDETGRLTGFLAVENEITARKDWELRSELSVNAARIFAGIDSTAAVITEFLKSTAGRLRCQFAAWWSCDSGLSLRLVQLWVHPEVRNPAFEAESKRTRLRSGEGLPGQAWVSAAIASAQVLHQEPVLDSRFLADAAPLRTGFAVPVRTKDSCFGVLEFLSVDSELPSSEILDGFLPIAGQLAQFLQRREAENERNEFLALLDSTLESTTEGILVTDIAGSPVRANRAFFDLWNYPEMSRKRPEAEHLRDWVQSRLSQECDHSQPFRSFRCDCGDEATTQTLELLDGRTFEVTSTPHRIRSLVVGRVWIYRDMTSRHLQEKEREALLATLNATLESTADGIVVTDLTGKSVIFNQRFIEMWRVPAEDFEQWTPRQRQDWLGSQVVDETAFRSMTRAMFRNPEELGFETFRLKDDRYFDCSSVPQKSGSKILGRVWSFRDVTERTMASAALKLSEERYRMISETASDGIIVVNHNNRIVFANDAASRIFGYGFEELYRATILDLVRDTYKEKDSSELIRQIWSQMRDESKRPIEFQARRRDGSEFVIEVSFGKSGRGASRFITGIVRDVTERRTFEVQLARAKRDAEAANAAKSQFLAHMSHEIRTPLNAMLGMSSLLMEGGLNSDQKELVQTIRTSGGVLLELINDILDFSKIEADQIELEHIGFDLHQCLEAAIDLVAHRALEKHLGIGYVLKENVPARLVGDVTRLRQILANLLNNAVKFTSAGEVSIIVQSETVEPGQWRLRFDVNDTGVGIPPDRLDRLFRPFTQVDGSTTRIYGGTGLGLVICKRLAEAMGGGITVRSEPGTGTTFSVEVVCGRSAEPQTPPDATVAGRRILVVVPDGIERRALVAHCRSWGLITICESSPGAAVSRMNLETFDVVVIPADLLQASDWRSLPPKVWRETRKLVPSYFDLVSRNMPLPENCNVVPMPLKASALYNAFAEHFGVNTKIGATHYEPEQVDDSIRSIRVLVAEDHPVNQKVIRQMLLRLGCSFEIVSNGMEAVAAVRQFRYDLVLLDLQMPEMDGIEAAQAIRALGNKIVQPQLVALTANASSEDRAQCLAAGMNRFLTKPITLSGLRNAFLDMKDTLLATAAVPAPVVGWIPPEEFTESDGVLTLDGAEIVSEFLTMWQDSYARLQQAVDIGNFEEIRRLAHSLKGSAAQMNAASLSDCAARIEQSAKERTPVDYGAALELTKQQFESTRREMQFVIGTVNA